MSAAENRVTAACMTYLKLQGAFVWRNNSRTVMVAGKGGKPRPMFFGLPGSPDIIGMLADGRFVGVECKRPLGPRGGANGSVQSDDQKAFQAECERSGGLYVLARSVDDVIRAVHGQGQFREELEGRRADRRPADCPRRRGHREPPRRSDRDDARLKPAKEGP